MSYKIFYKINYETLDYSKKTGNLGWQGSMYVKFLPTYQNN